MMVTVLTMMSKPMIMIVIVVTDAGTVILPTTTFNASSGQSGVQGSGRRQKVAAWSYVLICIYTYIHMYVSSSLCLCV